MGAKHATGHSQNKTAALEFLQCYERDGIFFFRIVTDDETCVSYKTPETI